jgi:hypothetical protein
MMPDFEPIAKKQFLMNLDLVPQIVSASYRLKAICSDDIEPLGRLLWLADSGGIYDTGQAQEESITEVREIVEGKYGTFLSQSSFAIVENGLLVSAVLFTEYGQEGKPLLALTMTHPNKKNQGLCQHLLQVSINSLISSGETRCFLSVAEGNVSAIRTYEKIGFRRR